MANTKITTNVIADDAITSAKLDTNIAIAGTLGVTGNITGTLATAAQTNITSLGTLTGLTTTGNINLGDNDKAIFGAGSDLQIYSDGSNSHIKDTGTGDLLIEGSDNIWLMQSGGAKVFLNTIDSNAINLYFNNSKKLETTNTGIDVTGTATMDGLTVGTTSTGQSIIQMLANSTNGANTIHFGDGASAAAYVGYINYAHDSNSLQFAANGSERMRITSAGAIEIKGSSTTTNAQAYITNDNSVLSIGSSVSGSVVKDISFNSPSTMMYIDGSSGNVGIGTDNPAQLLEVSGNGGKSRFTRSGSAGTTMEFYAGASQSGGIQVQSTGLGISGGAGENHVFIDTSGNLLVGTTATDTGAVGFRYRSSLDAISSVSDGGISAYFGRRSSDGDIVAFRKNDATVGSIGTEGGDMVIGTGTNCGLQFNDGNAAIRPFNMASNSAADNAVDLGVSGTRFKDLYLSGGAYLGGTAAANKLDDYEEGTWTPAFNMSSGSVGYNTTYTHGSYTKVGSLVCVVAAINLSSVSSPSGNLAVSGLPYNAGPGEKFVSGISIALLRNLNTNFTIVRGYVSNDGSVITLHTGATGGGHVPLNANTLQASTQFYFQLSYNTDE